MMDLFVGLMVTLFVILVGGTLIGTYLESDRHQENASIKHMIRRSNNRETERNNRRFSSTYCPMYRKH